MPEKFTGQRLDEETGFYYYNARYYDPELGRFISADSMVPAPTDPQSMNRYSYTRNNPIVLVDPSGHFFGAFIAFIGAIISAAAVSAAVSAGIAAITGGDVGQAALIGAITGAVFAPFGLAADAAFPGSSFGNYAGRAVINAIGSAAAGAAGAAIRGEPIGKGAWSGARFSIIASTANYIVGQWSGWSRTDEGTHLQNTGKQQGSEIVYGISGQSTELGSPSQIGDTIHTAYSDMIMGNYDGWLYNQARSGLQDTIESAQSLLFGPSSFARDSAGVLSNLAGTGKPVHLIAHSQGTINLTHSLRLSSGNFAKGSTAQFWRAPIGPIASYTSAWGAGLQVTAYDQHMFDIVSGIGTPWLLPTSVVALPVYIQQGARTHLLENGVPVFRQTPQIR